ncbi:MAG: ABC transporter permease [Burkholderiales bacterium]|nr:ABC transporter permease [Burkholderiales bacterium]
MEAFVTSWLATLPTFATPLLLASVGLIIAERAGVVSLAAEGYMAVGALAAAAVTLTTGQPGWGIALGVLAGAALALLFGIVAVVFRADQILAGLATVAAGLGITGVVGREYVHQTFEGVAPFDPGMLGTIPWIGPLLFGQDPLVYLALAVTVASWWAVFHTRFGLRLRAVGEDPATADVAGVDVQLHQLVAVALCGALCGLGGAYLSVAGSSVWVEGMVAGRGWIALSLVIFARWQPLRAVLGAALFGGVEALLPRLQAVGVDMPVYLGAMLPYALTIAVLIAAGVSRVGATAEPASLGLPYIRQDRR